MKNFIEILAGLGFVLSGTDWIFMPIYEAVNNPNPIITTSPLSTPAPNTELIQYLLYGIGLLLLLHVGYKYWQENSSNRV